MAACKGKSTEELIAVGLPKLASMGNSNNNFSLNGYFAKYDKNI